jgi:hypothetical protein
MKNNKATIIFLIGIITATLLIISCGGGGGTAPTSTSLSKDNAGAVSGSIVSTIGLIVEPTYTGTAAYEADETADRNTLTKQSFLMSLLKQAAGNIKSGQQRQGIRTEAGSIDITTNCIGGGTRKEAASWTGTSLNPENYTGTITYTNCKEGTATWNGTAQITYQGTYLSPTRITVVLNNMTYIDTGANTNLSLSGLTIIYADITYNVQSEVESASVLMIGSINGTLNSKTTKAVYDGFKMAYTFSGNSLNIQLSGKITPSCINRALTTATTSTLVLNIGSRCPLSGELTVSDETGSVKMTFSGQGGMTVLFNNEPAASYANCSQAEGMCL